jgi:hypothetical protein
MIVGWMIDPGFLVLRPSRKEPSYHQRYLGLRANLVLRW